jgi:NAD(P)-dependent dehydrogenase (short-subunit alcohol dehydrogenase family)
VTPSEFASLFDLTGRTAVITGGTRGIGRAIAEGFILAGANVVVASRKADACASTERALSDMGGQALGVPTHLGDLGQLTSLIDRSVDRFGGIDILVNNAANGLAMPIESITVDAWNKSFDVNLRGPVFLANAALPHLTASSHAAILNVISVGGVSHAPTQAMYAAAKAALLTFTRNTAAEWASYGVRVNALAPGTVLTDMLRGLGEDGVARVANISFQKRVARPDEMVGPALFLCSDAASYVTGQMLVADGGYVVAR